MLRLTPALMIAALLAPLPACAQVLISGAPETLPAPGVAVRATPQVDPSLWIGKEDYPPAAVRAEVEGRARFVLTVGTDGGVSDCALLESTNSSLLDEQTCTLLTRRAHFDAASRRNRTPISDRWSGSVDWKVSAEMRPAPEPVTCYDCGLGWTTFTETLTAPRLTKRKARRR